MTDWTTTFNRWRASLVGYGSFFRVGLAAALVLAGVFGARVMRRLFNQVRSLLTAHTPEWVHILVDGFQEPCVLLMRAGLWYCAAYAFPWPAGWMVSVYAIANKAMRVSFMLLIAWGIWNSSPLCGLLLKSAQNHLDLESNRTMRSFFEKVYRVLVVLMTLIAVAGEFTDVTALITGAGLAGLTVSLITAALLGLWRLLRRRVWLRRLKYRLRLLAFPVLLMVIALAFFLAFLFPVGIYLLRAG